MSVLARTASLTAWLRRRHDRHLLLSMDDRILADIGISRSDIDALVSGRRGR